MNRIALALSTWFGCGLFPVGPGTAGSLAAVIIVWTVDRYLGGTRQFLFGIAFLLLMPAIWSATVTARLSKNKDPGKVVIDEVLGQWVTLLGAHSFSFPFLAAGFVLFRVLDIWKPWPVSRLEALPDGYGIVADDIGAGVYGALILYIGFSAVNALSANGRVPY